MAGYFRRHVFLEYKHPVQTVNLYRASTCVKPLQSGDDREASFLFQRISALIQRFNAILLNDSFAHEDD